ncbi:DNA polymerase III subunit delta [Gracilimonas mengyeensis]|uniref:DNA polymerase III subunit delta n=1 Tax=Gracilimonas mengyeensis TaxID=1302730 RepID=A0A521AMI6_9BACT|nr:DNA polymerase III subunit delta [Gracilimonas mengyeensis]SMO36023.1 DNA polymerase III, delta subunit [Gracilimonas mengyeensis]
MARKPNSNQIYKQVAGELKSGNLKPVYYLFGEEEFYLDRLLNHFSKIIPEEQKDFNFDLLYGQEVSPAKALSIARSFPMMAERRVLIIRNFMQISKGGTDEGAASGHINDFISYIENPNPSTLLVLFDEKKPPGNTNLGKTVKKNNNVGFHEFERMADYLIPDWVIEWVQSHHDKRIEPAAAQLLAQFVGNNLQVLSTEIDKVCTFVDTSDTVSEADVKKIIGSYREFTAIELKEAIISRNMEQALYISEQMLQHTKSDTGELIRLVGFFNSVFVNIWQILRLSEKGLVKSQIQKELGIGSSWYFNKLWEDASNFRYSDMPRIFEALLDADRSAKGFSTLDSTSILFFLVKRIIG